MCRAQRAGDDHWHDIKPEQWARYESPQAAVEQRVKQVRAERPGQEQIDGAEARNAKHGARENGGARDRHQEDEQDHPNAKVVQQENAGDQRSGQIQCVQVRDRDQGSEKNAEENDPRRRQPWRAPKPEGGEARKDSTLRGREHSGPRALKGVDYRTDDASARVAQFPDEAAGIGDAGVVLARERDDRAHPESHVLRIRVELRRRSIEEDDIEFALHFLQESAEHGARQQLLWIGRGRAGRQKRKPSELPDGRDRAAVCATGQDRRQADPVGDIEDAVLPRCAQIGIDQERPLAELGKDHGEVGGHVAAPLARARAGNGQRPVPGPGLGPTHRQLGAQRPQLLGARVKRFVSDDELPADAVVAGQQVGKIILFRDRAAQVVLGDQAQAACRFAESQSLRLLELHDALDVAVAELAFLREDAADAAVVARSNAPRPFDRQDVLWRIHRHSQPGAGNARGLLPSPPSRRTSVGLQVWSTPSSGTSRSRSPVERTRRSLISISSTTANPSMVPTTTDSAMLSRILGWVGLPGTGAALRRVTLLWLARLSTWLTTWRCIAVS